MTETLPPPGPPATMAAPTMAPPPPPPPPPAPRTAPATSLPALTPREQIPTMAPSVRTQLAVATPTAEGTPRGAVRTYVVNGAVRQVGAGPMRATALPGMVMICSFAAVTAWLTKVAFHFTGRYHLANDGRARARLWEHDTVLLMAVLGALCLVAMGATALWSHAVVSNVERLGERRVSATWTAASWFIPFAWFQWGFAQLRKAPDADWLVWLWQTLFVAPFAISWGILRYFARVESRDLTADNVVTTTTHLQELQSAMLVSWAFVGCLLAATLVAARVVAGLHGSFGRADAASAAVGA